MSLALPPGAARAKVRPIDQVGISENDHEIHRHRGHTSSLWKDSCRGATQAFP